jgi:hypothetical protein
MPSALHCAICDLEKQVEELPLLKSLELAVRKLVNEVTPEDAHGVDELEEVKRLLDRIDGMHGDGRTLASIEAEIEASIATASPPAETCAGCALFTLGANPIVTDAGRCAGHATRQAQTVLAGWSCDGHEQIVTDDKPTG